VTLLFIGLEQKYLDKKTFDAYYMNCDELSKMLFPLEIF